MRRVGAVRRRAARATRGRRLVRHRDDCVVRVGTAAGTGLLGTFPLEEYVVGVVAGEARADWPDEFLAALSIAARSYALDRVVQPRDHRFDLRASTQDQAFATPQAAAGSVRRAVERTRGRYLVSDGWGRWLALPHRALFHTSC